MSETELPEAGGGGPQARRSQRREGGEPNLLTVGVVSLMGGLLSLILCGVSFLFLGNWWQDTLAGQFVDVATFFAIFGGALLLIVKAVMEVVREW